MAPRTARTLRALRTRDHNAFASSFVQNMDLIEKGKLEEDSPTSAEEHEEREDEKMNEVSQDVPSKSAGEVQSQETNERIEIQIDTGNPIDGDNSTKKRKFDQ